MKKFKILAALAILLLISVVRAWHDYTWDARYLSRVGPDWILSDRQTNAIDPILVWQIFKQPAHRIALIKRTSIVQFEPSVYEYVRRWVDRDWLGTITEEDFLSFADCRNARTGSLRDGAKRRTSADIDWRPCDDNPYAKSQSEKQKLRDDFSKLCNLLSTNGH